MPSTSPSKRREPREPPPVAPYLDLPHTHAEAMPSPGSSQPTTRHGRSRTPWPALSRAGSSGGGYLPWGSPQAQLRLPWSSLWSEAPLTHCPSFPLSSHRGQTHSRDWAPPPSRLLPCPLILHRYSPNTSLACLILSWHLLLRGPGLRH